MGETSLLTLALVSGVLSGGSSLVARLTSNRWFWVVATVFGVIGTALLVVFLVRSPVFWPRPEPLFHF